MTSSRVRMECRRKRPTRGFRSVAVNKGALSFAVKTRSWPPRLERKMLVKDG